MRILLGIFLAALVTLVPTPGASASVEPPAGGTPDWQGHRTVQPDSYAWLDDATPSDTYTIAVVRDLRRRQVLARLGGVRARLVDKTPAGAQGYQDLHTGPQLSVPRLVQVHRRGKAIVVFAPSGVLLDRALARLSRGKLAASFFTDVDLDTYVTVAKHGRVVRSFDAGFRPPRSGALPSEQGLDWGRPQQNIWATAWAFTERVTLTHLSQEWFDRRHPTYLVGPGGLY